MIRSFFRTIDAFFMRLNILHDYAVRLPALPSFLAMMVVMGIVVLLVHR